MSRDKIPKNNVAMEKMFDNGNVLKNISNI